MTRRMRAARPLVDTHAHLDDPGLAADLRGVLDRARAAGRRSGHRDRHHGRRQRRGRRSARPHPGVFAAVGIQPNDVAEAGPGDWDRVVALADAARVVARSARRGSTATGTAPRSACSGTRFDRTWTWPSERACRSSSTAATASATSSSSSPGLGRPVRGVLHSFTGTWETPRHSSTSACTSRSPGWSPSRTSRSTRSARRPPACPLDRLLVETDSPYLSPHPFRGRPTSPPGSHSPPNGSPRSSAVPSTSSPGSPPRMPAACSPSPMTKSHDEIPEGHASRQLSKI